MVYLLCFERDYKGTQHYIGFVESDLEQRIKCHKNGNGARFVEVLKKENGIDFQVVRLWPEGDRKFERKLKNRKNAWQLCPICKERRKSNGSCH